MRKLTNFVKVERIISRDGAVETRLEKRCPAVTELVRSASIRFADASDARVNRLEKKKKNNRKTVFRDVIFGAIFEKKNKIK